MLWAIAIAGVVGFVFEVATPRRARWIAEGSGAAAVLTVLALIVLESVAPTDKSSGMACPASGGAFERGASALTLLTVVCALLGVAGAVNGERGNLTSFLATLGVLAGLVSVVVLFGNALCGI